MAAELALAGEEEEEEEVDGEGEREAFERGILRNSKRFTAVFQRIFFKYDREYESDEPGGEILTSGDLQNLHDDTDLNETADNYVRDEEKQLSYLALDSASSESEDDKELTALLHQKVVMVKKEVNWDEEEEKLREKRKNRMAKAKHSSSSSSEDEAGDSEATLHRKRHRQRCSQKKGWRLGVTGQNFNGGDVSETIYETEYHSEYEPSHVHSEPEEVGWSTPPPRPRLFRDAHSAPRLPRQRQQQNPTSEMRHSANLDRKLPIPIANLNVPKTDDDDMAEGFVSGYNSDSEYLSGYDDYGSHRTTNMASKRLEYVDTPDDFSPSQSGAHDTPNNLSPSKYGVHDTPDNLSPGKSGAHDTPDDLSPSKSGTHDTPDNLSGAHSPPDMSPSLFSSDQVDEDIPIGSGDQGDEKRAVNGMETVPQESSEERDEMKCGFAPCACGRQVGVDGRSCDRHMTTPTVMYTNITYVTYCRCSLCCRPQWCNNGCHTLTSPPLHQCHYCHSTHTQHPQHYQTTNSVGYHPFVRTSVDPDHNGPDQTSNVSLNKRKLDINPSDQLPDGTAEPPNKKPCL